jgi:hypothetical protein
MVGVQIVAASTSPPTWVFAFDMHAHMPHPAINEAMRITN